MIYVFYSKINDSVGEVTMIHHQPELLSDNEKVNGIMMQEFPIPESYPGKMSIPYINLETMQPYYEYKDRPLTREEEMQKEIDALKAELSALK